MAYIYIERGKNKGQRIEIKIPLATIGRDPSCDIMIEDDQISRYHCEIKCRGKIFIIRDVNSRNGTYLNGEKIIDSALHNTDRILLGNTELIFLSSGSKVRITDQIKRLDQHEKNSYNEIKGTKNSDQQFSAIRLDLLNIINNAAPPNARLNAISNLVRNTLVLSNIEEICQYLVKSLPGMIGPLKEVTLFLWQKEKNALVPAAKTSELSKYSNEKNYLIRESVSRKIGAIIEKPKNEKLASIPLLSREDLVGVLYLRTTASQARFDKMISDLTFLLMQISPSIENLMLRKEMETWMLGIVETLISTVEAKDTYTRGHSERVCKISLAIADEMKLDPDTKKMLMISSLCHDIGKIGIPDYILKKASLLSAEEYEEMKLHPSLGAAIIESMPYYSKIVGGVKSHHEKWDGTGYPEGLAGEDIPFFGRIVAIADVFDAMISGRSYSGFVGPEEAIETLKNEQDLFDPHIFSFFIKAYNSGKITIKTSTLSNEIKKPTKKT